MIHIPNYDKSVEHQEPSLLSKNKRLNASAISSRTVTNKNETSRRIKIVILGDGAVGKTSLLSYYSTGKFKDVKKLLMTEIHSHCI
jgi:GTPase SAR1 family protein